jgi:hypothetical protein
MMAMVGVAPEALKELNSAVPVIFGAVVWLVLLIGNVTVTVSARSQLPFVVEIVG